MTGVHTGDVPGLPATGKPFRISGAGVGEIRDGKLARVTEYWNMAEFLIQVGVLPRRVPDDSQQHVLWLKPRCHHGQRDVRVGGGRSNSPHVPLTMDGFGAVVRADRAARLGAARRANRPGQGRSRTEWVPIRRHTTCGSPGRTSLP